MKAMIPGRSFEMRNPQAARPRVAIQAALPEEVIPEEVIPEEVIREEVIPGAATRAEAVGEVTPQGDNKTRVRRLKTTPKCSR